MLVYSEVRNSRLTEFLCYRSSVILILFLSAGHCVQVRTFVSNPEFASTDVPRQNASTASSGYDRSSSGAIPVKNLDQQILFQNVTDMALETLAPVTQHQNDGNQSMEITSSEFSDDYADYGDFNLSYVAPEVLLDLEPQEMILSHDQAASQQMRKKPVRDGFVRDQEMELLRLHNFYRSNVTPPAADMSFMEWNEDIARVAQDWANRCQFRHGFPPHSYPGVMGQNLYMGYDSTGVRALLLWYEEYQYYNYETLECLADKQCGHYTQMAWGSSSFVGCGMKRCGAKFFVVCHYSPPGNVVGYSPYVVGKPCSQCQSDHGGLCTKNLCVTEDQCFRNQENCDPFCPLKCHNCGIFNSATCKCSCADGWDSLDCSRRCTNEHESCGKNPGWPSAGACSMNQNAVADMYCRKMCGKCHDIENAISTNTCCSGLVCDDGYVIDQNRCKCRLLCPGPKCHDGEDSGSLYLSKNVYMILFAVAVQMTFIL